MHDLLCTRVSATEVLSVPHLRTGAEIVYETLRDGVIAGRIAPGTRLTEVALCAEFGLSTTPVREALQRLVHRGLAVRQTARGVKVRELSPSEIEHIYELRCLLEPAALRSSVSRLPATRISEIARLVDEARRALARGDRLGLSALNDDFHMAILEGTPNRLLLQWIETLGDQRRLIAVREWTLRDRAARELDEHAAILERITHRDDEGAAALLLTHIRTSAEPVEPRPTGAEGGLA